ncbi:MAG: T9SS type A sorting domain-containing protein [Bacteroidota bacterium]|nr:T9SS type A sorting domain-containing protein [Bacteroidota bacterium]
MTQRLQYILFLGLMSITLCTAQHIYDNRIDTSCGLIWGPVWQLTPDNIDAGFPIIVNQGDTLHITMLTNDSGIKYPYIRSVDGGRTFETLRELVRDTTINIVSSCVLVHTRTTLYAFWRDAVKNILYMMKSTDQGLNWTTPRMVMDSMAYTAWYRAGIEDTILLGVNRYQGTGNIHGILRTTDAGKTWTLLGPIAQRNSPDIAYVPGKLYRITRWLYDSSGHNAEYVIQYKVSTDLGETWSDSINLSTVRGGSFTADSKIAADPTTGKIVAAWRDAKYGCEALVGCSVMERHLDDIGRWTNEYLLTERPNGYNPNISIREKHINILWVNDLNARANFRFSVDGGTTWSTVCEVYDSNNTGLASSSVLIGNSVHFVGTSAAQVGPDKLLYRRAELLPTSVQEWELPKNTFILAQNYPNPFNPKTKIGFRLQVSGFTSLKVYDIFGREVAVLVNEKLETGKHEVEWDPSTSFGSAQDGGSGQVLASGIYFYRIVQGNFTSVGKAVFLK